MYAWALLQRYPHCVRQVITLGTPYAELRHVAAAPPGPADNGNYTVAAVPAFSLYSRLDGVVAWQGCVPTNLPNHHVIAVDGVKSYATGASPGGAVDHRWSAGQQSQGNSRRTRNQILSESRWYGCAWSLRVPKECFVSQRQMSANNDGK